MMKSPRYPPMTRHQVLRACRARGWSQNELARRIGRAPGYVSRVLRGLAISRPVWRAIVEQLSHQETTRGHGE